MDLARLDSGNIFYVIAVERLQEFQINISMWSCLAFDNFEWLVRLTQTVQNNRRVVEIMLMRVIIDGDQGDQARPL